MNYQVHLEIMWKTRPNVNMDKQVFDICVIGGGINGAGIARDAAGRGYNVLLIEKGDLASGTSSASTKLIHGGLRYLEQYEFGLVRKALKERDVLLNLAPHIIWPMRFVLPHAPHLRPLWMIRVGTWVYDFLACGTKLKKSIKTNVKNKYLSSKFKNGIEYSDCWVEDSRLVILNAMDAMARGAVVKTNTTCQSIRADDDQWIVDCGGKGQFKAQMIVNAAGPWAADVMDKTEAIKPQPLRLVKGSHIVVPKLYKESESYILQNEDGRIVFTIPYEGEFTLIGTTDVDVGRDPSQKPEIDEGERQYLKSVVKYYFNKNIKDIDIIYNYSGVRPLMDSGEEAAYASRDYEFDVQHINRLPYLSVLGGKITTYRILSEQLVDLVDKEFHKSPAPWTRNAKLPGGDIKNNDFEQFVREQQLEFPFLSQSLIRRYARAYGTCMNIILDGVKNLADMGTEIGGGVYAHELDYLRAYEFAVTADDVLWRRSKLGLHLDKDTQKAIKKYMDERV